MKTLVILAGGKSTRMGKDKIFLHIFERAKPGSGSAREGSAGLTFIDYLYQKALPVFDQVLISAGSTEHAEKIEALLPEARIIPDRYESIGPMGGILSVYEETGIERFAVVPADVPGAELRVLSYFWEHCGEESCLLVCEGEMEPLIAAYGKKTLSRMQELRKDGCYRLRKAFSEGTLLLTEKEIKAALPELSDTDLKKAFTNINTTQEYEAFQTDHA